MSQFGDLSCYKIRTTYIRSPLKNQNGGEDKNGNEKERSYGIHLF